MRKRLARILALGTIPALMLAGCSGGADEAGSESSGGSGVDFKAAPSGTLKAWGFNNADDVGQSRLDYAAEQLADVDVQLDGTGFDVQKFTTRMASGDVPDVVQMDRAYVTQYAAQGFIVPLDECFAAQDVSPKDRWYESVVADVTYKDQTWGVPQFYQPPAILLNMDVMTKNDVAPEDIDTSKPDVLLGAAEKMYEKSGGNPSRLGFDPVATGQAPLWVLSQGGQLSDADGKPTLDNPANAAGINLLKQMTDAQGGFAKVKSFSDSFDFFGDNNQFVKDQVGSQIAAQWYPNVLSPYLDKVDLRAVPFRDSKGAPFSVAGGTAFVIPKGATNPAAACAWMNNLTSLEAWLAAGEARAQTLKEDGGINTGLFTGSPEADKQIREKFVKPSGNDDFDQVIETFYEVVDYGTTYGSSPAGQTIQSELTKAVTAALLGSKTAEEALKDAQDAAMRAYDNAVS